MHNKIYVGALAKKVYHKNVICYTIFFEFVTWPPFLASNISVKWWQSDKFKENFETYIKVHCYAAIIKIINYEVFRCMVSLE